MFSSLQCGLLANVFFTQVYLSDNDVRLVLCSLSPLLHGKLLALSGGHGADTATPVNAPAASTSQGNCRSSSGSEALQRSKRSTRSARIEDMHLDEDAHFHSVAAKHRAHAAGIVCGAVLTSSYASISCFHTHSSRHTCLPLHSSGMIWAAVTYTIPNRLQRTVNIILSVCSYHEWLGGQDRMVPLSALVIRQFMGSAQPLGTQLFRSHISRGSGGAVDEGMMCDLVPYGAPLPLNFHCIQHVPVRVLRTGAIQLLELDFDDSE